MSDSHSLDRALVSGLAWTALLRWGSQVLSWVATFFVARILLPSDYGLVSMATVAIGLVRMVEDVGMDSILVQDRSIVGDRQARLAGFVVTLGVAFFIVFLLLAEPIALFFKEPLVARIVPVLAFLFITDALQVVPRAALQRDLQFRRLAVALFVQVLVTQTVLVTAALAGWGVWSLVLNSVAGAVALTALLIFWKPYQLRWPRDIRSLASPLLRGWRVLASRIAWYGYTTADQTIVGRMLGKDALGAYSFATTFAGLPFQEVNSVVSRVVPGIFSRTQERRDELRRYFLLLTECICYLTLPMAIGFYLTADLVVGLALGPGWEAVVSPLKWLCVYAGISSTQVLMSHVIMWTGQFRAYMWLSLLQGVSLPLGFLFAVRYGLSGVGIAWAVLYPLTNIPAVVIAFRTMSMTVWQWLEVLRPSAVSSVAMVVVVLFLRSRLPADLPVATQCVAVVGAGALVYAATLFGFFRQRVMNLIEVIRAVHRPELPLAPQQVS